MIEFNPDGSLKLPENIVKSRQESIEKMKNQRCIKMKREIVSDRAPKKCKLYITLSDKIQDNRFVDNIYKYFAGNAKVPTKIIKVNEKEFEVEVGTDFRRCSDCSSLISRYREFMDGNMIEDKGGCDFGGMKRSFCYEDYFD